MLIHDILPPEKIKKIAKEDILGIKSYKNKKSKYLNIYLRFLIVVIIFIEIFSTFSPLEVFGESGFWGNEKQKEEIQEVPIIPIIEELKMEKENQEPENSGANPPELPIADSEELKIKKKYDQAETIKQKYKLDKSVFIIEAKDKNSIQIEVGDKIKNEFTPEMTLRKWDDEVNFKVKYKHNIAKKDQSMELDGKKIKWKNHKTEVHYYEMKKGEILLGNELESDVYEIEVILLEKPDTNVVEFDIETKGLNFYYQSELNLEDNPETDYCTETQCFKDGKVIIHRPENVVGSYAVYHKSKQGDYSQMDGKNYRAGKAFHIYRPKIIDSAGKEVWGKLNVTDNLLTVEIPQEFLDKDAYPVIVDPTFGVDPASPGGTREVQEAGRMKSNRSTYSPLNDGLGVSMSAYTADSGDVFKLGLYDTNWDFITNGGTNEGSAPASADWVTCDFSTQPSLLATEDYYLVYWSGTSYIGYYYDSVGPDHYSEDAAYGSWPSSITPGLSGIDKTYSIYCTYTATGSTYQPRPVGVGISGGGFMMY